MCVTYVCSRCVRCDTCLGDGYLEADGSADVAATPAPATTSAAPFNMVDLRDVRLALQNVSFSTSLLFVDNKLSLSLEQVRPPCRMYSCVLVFANNNLLH